MIAQVTDTGRVLPSMAFEECGLVLKVRGHGRVVLRAEDGASPETEGRRNGVRTSFWVPSV